jgi:hypothetical protein
MNPFQSLREYELFVYTLLHLEMALPCDPMNGKDASGVIFWVVRPLAANLRREAGGKGSRLRVNVAYAPGGW